MSTTAKEAEGLSYLELKALLEQKKEAEIDKVKKELSSAEGIVASLKAQLVNLGVEAPAANEGTLKGKRGRPRKNNFNPTKPKKSKGKRDSGLKDTILTFLTSKGKEGAHVDDIAKHTGKPKANINAFLATTGKKAGIKGKGHRSGVYFLK